MKMRTCAVKRQKWSSQSINDMNFKQIEAFRAVMLSGSMTIAAGQLHTSQSNVSRSIAVLQRETGLRLFERVGIRVLPTPEAQSLMREVERSFLGLEAIHNAALRIRAFGVDGLRVSVSPALAISLVPRALELFRRARPGVHVVISATDSVSICKAIGTGVSDVGLAAAVALPQEVDSELIHTQSAVCIVPAGHRLSSKRSVKPVDLGGECFISMPSYDIARHAVDQLFRPEVRRLEIETSQASTICVMVARGLGVSIVNPLILRELALPGITALPFKPEIRFRCYAIRAKQRPGQTLAADFLAATKRAITEL